MGKLKAAAMLFCTNPYSLAPRRVTPRSSVRCGYRFAGKRYRSLIGRIGASVTRTWGRVKEDSRQGGPIGEYQDLFTGRALCESA